jgi:hypothetical protein
MFRHGILVLAMLIAAAPLTIQTVLAENIGRVVAVVGSASASGPAGDRKLAAKSEIFEDDKITVPGAGGNAQIELVDGTKLVVGPKSSLVIDQFLLQGNKRAEKISFRALRGTYRFISGKSPKSAYKITTAHATIGIRGTGFDVWVKGKTGVVVLRGGVRMNGLQTGGVDVNSGCQLGESTTTASRRLTGREKEQVIKENLPFLFDQSSLRPRFRLSIRSCNIVPPDGEGGRNNGEGQGNRRGNDGEQQPDTPDRPDTPDSPDSPNNPDGQGNPDGQDNPDRQGNPDPSDEPIIR